MRNELMTGWLNTPAFISMLTIQSFQDLGYNVVAIPELSSFVQMLVPSCAVLLAFSYACLSRRNVTCHRDKKVDEGEHTSPTVGV